MYNSICLRVPGIPSKCGPGFRRYVEYIKEKKKKNLDQQDEIAHSFPTIIAFRALPAVLWYVANDTTGEAAHRPSIKIVFG